jgi:hypothetical protein
MKQSGGSSSGSHSSLPDPKQEASLAAKKWIGGSRLDFIKYMHDLNKAGASFEEQAKLIWGSSDEEDSDEEDEKQDPPRVPVPIKTPGTGSSCPRCGPCEATARALFRTMEDRKEAQRLLQSFTVKELKEASQLMNLKTTGTKDMLIRQLQESGRCGTEAQFASMVRLLKLDHEIKVKVEDLTRKGADAWLERHGRP